MGLRRAGAGRAAARRPVLDARAVALDLLTEILDRHRPLDQALEGSVDLAGLEPRDRGFARLLVVTVLRRLGSLDAMIDRCLDRPLPARAAVIRHVLRLGAAQIASLGTPSHAAVDATVRLCAPRRLQPWRALVNAVLRRLAREAAMDDGSESPFRDTPDWLVRSWTAAYGETTAAAIARAHREEPPLDLTVKGDPDGWAERLGGGVLPTGSVRLTHAGRVDALHGYTEGAWWVQDAAAALPARLLGDVAGQRVLDFAAAPGGKTAQLARAGARVTAVDASQSRQELTRANLGRLGLEAEIVVGDARRYRAPEPFDAVLLDVPCSATGTIRRHPDVLWLKRPEDLETLVALQAELIDAALASLRPGGTLVYACCSLEPIEGPEQIARLLARRPDLERVPVTPAEVGGLPELIAESGDLRTLPCHLGTLGGMDGFYAARLRLVPAGVLAGDSAT